MKRWRMIIRKNGNEDDDNDRNREEKIEMNRRE